MKMPIKQNARGAGNPRKTKLHYEILPEQMLFLQFVLSVEIYFRTNGILA
jgi:hypothetical protein